MKITKQLAMMGFSPEQIATATERGQPLRPDTKTLGAKTDGMNKTEARFAAELDWLKREGDVAAWWFESVKLRLADRTWFTPDFLVVYSDGRLRFVEIKGFLRDDAAVKFKVAREIHTWAEWTMLRWRNSRTALKGQWVPVNI